MVIILVIFCRYLGPDSSAITSTSKSYNLHTILINLKNTTESSPHFCDTVATCDRLRQFQPINMYINLKTILNFWVASISLEISVEPL